MGQGDSEHLLKVTAQHSNDVMQHEDTGAIELSIVRLGRLPSHTDNIAVLQGTAGVPWSTLATWGSQP